MVSAQLLPFDIIHEILAQFSTPLSIYSTDKRKDDFPWFLGHLCSSWRTVFSSMYAEFWSIFIMSPEAPLCTVAAKRSIDIATLFTEHTRDRPFSLSLRLRYMPRPVIDLFVDHSMQWQRVVLIFEEKHIPLLSNIKNRVPLLYSLRLLLDHPIPLPITPHEPIVLFENAPLLAHLQLHHLWRWQFNWPSLSSLALNRHIDVEAFLEILAQLGNLETLQVMQSDKIYTNINPTIPIMMTRLKVLTTLGCKTLAFMTAPSLERLHIGTCWSQSFSFGEPFLKRSSCQLLHLSIGHCDTEALAGILPFVPTIESLYVGCNPVPITEPLRYLYVDLLNTPLKDFFHTLACPPGEPLLVPFIHTIRFSMLSSLTEEDVIALRSMISLRRIAEKSPRPRLRQVIILPCQEEYSETEDRTLRMLEKLRMECGAQGILFKIKPIPYACFQTSFYDDGGSLAEV